MKMTENNLNRLKEILSVPTHSRNEELMIEYLKGVLTDKGYEHYVDVHGNIYATKGVTEWYPCFVAHTDTVHVVNENLTVIQEELKGKVTLRGIDGVSGKPSGIGGDDKCGVYLALEMLNTLPNVKIALFVSEEIGCKGSMYADPEFFKNVGYAIQYDSPEGDSMSLTLMGRYLYNQESDFSTKVKGLITEHGIKNWAYHPYTDVWQIMEKFNIACLNLAAGYYRYHTENEYVVVDEVQNGFELGLKLVEQLGENKYENPKEERTYSWSSYWRGGVTTTPAKSTTGVILNESTDNTNDDDWDSAFTNGVVDYIPNNGFGVYYNRRFTNDGDYF